VTEAGACRRYGTPKNVGGGGRYQRVRLMDPIGGFGVTMVIDNNVDPVAVARELGIDTSGVA
jgi:hypothetical protein